MDIHQGTLIAELESLPGIHERIDRVASDLISGERRYADIDARRLGELLGVEFGFADGWWHGRAWALRKNLPGVDFSPDAKRELRVSDKLYHYSRYEAQAEEASFTPGSGLKDLVGWCSWLSIEKYLLSSKGVAFRFTQLTSDGESFEVLGPYIDGIEFDDRDLFELRFIAFPYDWNILEWYSTYLYEMDCDENDIHPEPEGPTTKELLRRQDQIMLLSDWKCCNCEEGEPCTCGAGLLAVSADGCCSC